MSYVDVETSAEAIMEDEELIEAVEQIVEKAAEAIYTDLKNDVSGLYMRLYIFVQSNFPFLIYWREDQSLFWADMQKISIFAFLFGVSFFILAPSRRWRRKYQDGNGPWSSFSSPTEGAEFRYFRTFSPFYSRTKQNPRFSLERSRSTSSIDYRVNVNASGMEHLFEETEEEKFAKRWSDVLESSYSILVLPPECKRVEKPKKRRDDKKKEKAKKENANDKDDHDHPANRLLNYTRNLLYLMVSFLKYDYVGAGRALIHWVEACFRSRQNRSNNGDHEDDEDDESDAGSLRSVSGPAQSNPQEKEKASYRPKIRGKRDTLVQRHITAETGDKGETNDTDDASHASLSIDPAMTDDSEEKKEAVGDAEEHNYETPPASPLTTYDASRKILGPNTYSTPKQEGSDELDPGDALAAKVLLNGRQPKMKDALQSYRNPTRTSAPNLPPSPMIKRIVTNDSNFASMFPERSGLERLSSERSTLDRHGTEQSAYYFEAASTNESILKMKVEVPVPDKNGYILGDEFLPDATDWTPLLVFVNSRSGPQQGQLLIAQLRGLLNPIQVWDLADGGPEEILESFSTFTRLRILVCGGDGTVSWIVSTIENMKLQRWPPIAILPLGTGNDLARIHGWGGGYNNESLLGILKHVAESYISWLDRWEMTIENKKGKVKSVKSFFNYLGVGADAQAALQVHMLREKKPQLFFSRVVNKAWYGVFGAEDIIKATSVNLPHEITLIADGVEVPLPSDSQGIILLNIDSYAGGVPLWANGSKGGSQGSSPLGSRSSSWNGIQLQRSRSFDAIKGLKKAQESKFSNHTPSLGRVDSTDDLSLLGMSDEEKFLRVTACDRPSSCQDGLLDIVSIRGAFHLGQIRVGLSNAQKLCQCREATIIIKRKVSVQTDGEPWRQNVCTLRVKRKRDAAIMLHRSADDSNGVETEMSKLLEWAEERKLIDSKVHAALMKEFSRRIETMTRERRVRSQDNLMFSLKRAMASTGNINKGNSNGIMF